MEKANFQILRHISSAMVNNCSTYEDFIGCYSDLEYIKNSKYTRQVVFGKLNPKRQMTCEKFFINEIRKLIDNTISSNGGEIVSMSNDELVYKISEPKRFTNDTVLNLAETIKTVTDFTVHTDVFKLNGYEFQLMDSGKSKFTFFEKEFADGRKKLKSVPIPFYKMICELPLN